MLKHHLVWVLPYAATSTYLPTTSAHTSGRASVSFQSDDHLLLRACLEFPTKSRHFPASLKLPSHSTKGPVDIVGPSLSPPAGHEHRPAAQGSGFHPQHANNARYGASSPLGPLVSHARMAIQWSPCSNLPAIARGGSGAYRKHKTMRLGACLGAFVTATLSCACSIIHVHECNIGTRSHPAAPWLGPASAFAGIGGSSHTWAWSKFRSMFMEGASSSTSHGIMLILVASDMDILLPNSISLSHGLHIGFETVVVRVFTSFLLILSHTSVGGLRRRRRRGGHCTQAYRTPPLSDVVWTCAHMTSCTIYVPARVCFPIFLK